MKEKKIRHPLLRFSSDSLIFFLLLGALFFEMWGRSGFDGDVSGSGCSGVATFNAKTKETTIVSNLG